MSAMLDAAPGALGANLLTAFLLGSASQPLS